jgi:hypothetical protein
MTLTGVVDDHMLSQYRVLLDREDAAFDELEHAYEDGTAITSRPTTTTGSRP